MSIDAITSLDDLRAQIVQKLRDSLALDPDEPLPSAAPNDALQELRSQVLAKAREQLGASLDLSVTKSQDVVIDMEDMRTRMLMFRIKNANISRSQRDSLVSYVRSLAVDDRIDGKVVKGISEMVFLMEMNSNYDRRKELKTLPLEKTVDEEMSKIYSMKSQREAMKERLEELQSKISE